MDPHNNQDTPSLRSELLRLCDSIEKDRENFIALTRELSSISGSLKVLLEDRAEAKNQVQRMYSTLDNLKERMTAAETKLASMSTSQTNTSQRAWQIFSLFLTPAITIIITYLFVKR